MILPQNSDFLFLFEAVMTNPNGDRDKNKPRMDYETNTALVSDARRKRDIRDFLKRKGYPIFVDTLNDKKVPMEKMFEHIRDQWLADDERFAGLREDAELEKRWTVFVGKEKGNYKEQYMSALEAINKKKGDNKKKSEWVDFNNEFLTLLIRQTLIDIRLFGSAMAVEDDPHLYRAGANDVGLFLHPVELVKSNTITSIMNDDASTFGKKHKLYYGLFAHSGTMNKHAAQLAGMTVHDRELFQNHWCKGSSATDGR